MGGFWDAFDELNTGNIDRQTGGGKPAVQPPVFKSAPVLLYVVAGATALYLGQRFLKG